MHSPRSTKNSKISATLSVYLRVAFWLLLLFGGMALSIHFDKRYFADLLASIPFHILSFLIGLALLRISTLLAANAGRELHRMGRRGDIPRLQTNRLVTTGPYECSRHPMLFGLMLLPLAFALLLGLPTFIFFIAPIEAAVIFVLMVVVDEAEAMKKFGKEYEAYRRKTPIWPSKECWKRLFSSNRPKDPL